MSSVTFILIILINNIHQTSTISQCDLLNAIDIQSATYSHSLILRVQPIYSSETSEKAIAVTEVLVREVIKLSNISYHKIKMNDIILVRTDSDLEELLDDSCWYLLRITTIDIILFHNETNTNEFDLRYPPMESTLYVRQNIDAVMNYDTYSPQVIIKTQIDKPIELNSYSLQCNARGNPLPHLLWSRNNQRSDYYPSMKDCKTLCRIYSIQNEYVSILYFQALTSADSGIYVCHAENAINYTMTSVYIDIDQTNTINRSNINVTCATLKYCHHRGQCIADDHQWKCLCDNQFTGERCEINYGDIIKKQNNTIHVIKYWVLVGGILILGFIFILLALIACFYARRKRIKRNNLTVSKRITNGKTLKNELIEHINKSQTQQSLSMPIVRLVNDRSILRKQSALIASDNYDDEDDGHYQHEKNSNGCSRSIDEECNALNMNNIRESSFETTTHNLILSEGYLESDRPDAQSGLIRPLSKRADSSKRHKKYISSRNRLLASRSTD
ncbi:unnamed protein product [Rotaria socialis]|uniref:Uncharacterized protein n=1 Tax=Rotaria socialis TaxID=392032 RepID=A0A820FD88_9BILA|nr:unnamed protein product [Rotaria socialis]CAF4260431.1 unnamed protein product [Rotaria socialis]